MCGQPAPDAGLLLFAASTSLRVIIPMRKEYWEPQDGTQAALTELSPGSSVNLLNSY